MIKNLTGQIYKDTNIKLILANQDASRHDLPFATYNITSPYIKDVGYANITYEDTGDKLIKKRDEQYKITISFIIHAGSEETAIDLANKVRQWFLFYGEDYIRDLNIAVVSVGNVENRTTFMVDTYEYRHGFDVQLRLSDEQAREVEYFDKIEINGGRLNVE